MRLLLPPALTIAFLPFVYMLRSYIRWEDRCFQRRWRRDFAADQAFDAPSLPDAPAIP
jgi:hypothetical protein